MNWREVFGIALFLLVVFTAGYVLGYRDGYIKSEQSGGGVSVREATTNNSRRNVLLKTVKPLDDSQGSITQGDCSPTAAAMSNMNQSHTSGMAERNRCNELSGKLRSEMLQIDEVKNGCNSLPAILFLLWKAESGYGRAKDGDGGQAKGHFQQHRSHWVEGCTMLGVSWPYPEDTNNLARAAAITAANWAKYAPQALKGGDLELLIRTHRLPSARYRTDNDSYIARVLKGE